MRRLVRTYIYEKTPVKSPTVYRNEKKLNVFSTCKVKSLYIYIYLISVRRKLDKDVVSRRRTGVRVAQAHALHGERYRLVFVVQVLQEVVFRVGLVCGGRGRHAVARGRARVRLVR
jgi:hypothetical protein